MSAKDDAVARAVREIRDGLLRANRSPEEAFAIATACKPILARLAAAKKQEGFEEGVE